MSTLGNQLQESRQDQSLSIDQVAKATRIPKQTISALENSDWSELPAKPYACGFVKSYGKYLGLSPDECLQLFEEEIRDHDELQRPAELSDVPTPQVLTETQSLYWVQAPKAWVAIGLTFFVSALLAVTFFAFEKMSSYKTESELPGETVLAPVPKPNSANSGKGMEGLLALRPPKQTALPQPQAFRTVSFYATKATKLSIYWANGKTQDVSMEANEIKNIQYYRPLRIVATNGLALKIRKPDKKFAPLTQKSGPVELRYP